MELLRSQLAAVTGRVYALEQAQGELKTASSAVPTLAAEVAPASGLPKAPPTLSQTIAPAPPTRSTLPPILSQPKAGVPPLPTFAHVSRAPSGDLERKIRQYWLNRIGIVAVLTGVSY